MIIFDSSVWIDYFKYRRNKKSDFLRLLIKSKEEVCVAPVVVQEVLQGFSDPSYFDVAHIVLTDQKLLEYDALDAAVEGQNSMRLCAKSESPFANPTTA